MGLGGLGGAGPGAQTTIGSVRLASCQPATEWKGRCSFPWAAAEVWEPMLVAADGPGLPTL